MSNELNISQLSPVTPHHAGQVPSLQRPRKPVAAALVCAALSMACAGGMWANPAAAQMTGTEVPLSIEMKVLVLSVDGTEPSLAAATSILDQVNIPYDVVKVREKALTASMLSDGLGNGKYQGIILATSSLPYQVSPGNYASSLTAEQWQMLWNYESTYKVRQVTMFTAPYTDVEPNAYCLTPGGTFITSNGTLDMKLTPAGQNVFNYLNTAATITVRDAYTYQTTAAAGATPLLMQGNNAIVSTCKYANGRENLAITADNNPNLLHTLALGYGVVNWVTKGFFIGSRQVYLNAQPDDLMLANDLWDPVNLTTDETEAGPEYRMTGSDLNKTITWQRNVRTRNGGLFAGFALEMPYNGVGIASVAAGGYADTTLKKAIYNNENEFRWISHTYTHALLDVPLSSSQATTELQKNNQTANSTIGMSRYFKDSMIQPEISGLNNPQFIGAAYNFGIRNILCDISHLNECLTYTSRKPNVGYYVNRNGDRTETSSGDILVIPRYAANLYYNVSTPVEWESEYNYFYAPDGLFPAFQTKQTINDIINTEANNWLRYMLKYSIYSMMFHQSNLRFYGTGQTSLLTSLVDATLNKYAQLFNLKVTSFSQHDQAQKIRDRMTFDDAGVKGTLKLGTTNSVVFTAAKAAKIPVTGIAATGITGVTSETYGGQVQSAIPITAGGTVTVVNAPAW